MPLYYAALQEIKSEVNLKMAVSNDLQLIRVTQQEYNDPGVFDKTDAQEFRFKGQLYDYKGMKMSGTDYIFYGLQDNKETAVIDFLKAAFGQSNESSKNTNAPLGTLLKNFSKDFIGSFANARIYAMESTFHGFLFYPVDICKGHYKLIQNPPDAGC